MWPSRRFLPFNGRTCGSCSPHRHGTCGQRKLHQNAALAATRLLGASRSRCVQSDVNTDNQQCTGPAGFQQVRPTRNDWVTDNGELRQVPVRLPLQLSSGSILCDADTAACSRCNAVAVKTMTLRRAGKKTPPTAKPVCGWHVEGSSIATSPPANASAAKRDAAATDQRKSVSRPTWTQQSMTVRRFRSAPADGTTTAPSCHEDGLWSVLLADPTSVR